MVAKKKIDLLKIIQEIVGLNSKMRFAAIIDAKGHIREGIMKKGQTSLNSQKEEEHFCAQVAQRRTMRKEFDRSLGKVRYIHVEREKVSQLVIYTKRNSVLKWMKTGVPLIIIGVSMFILGLMLFYLIDGGEILKFIKNMGTFVGLSGIGVTLAGILLYLIKKNEQPIKENYDI